MMRAWGTLLSLSSLACVAACYQASTTATGGDPRFDAGLPAAPATDAALSTGSTFAELYRDYFGPSGRASCAGDGQCHGGAEQPGAKASNYVCGPTAAACYDGMKAGSLILPADGAPLDPAKTFLYLVLRKPDGSGIMPKRPPYVFQESDLARVREWLNRGAPLDGTDVPDAAADAAALDAGLDATSDAGVDASADTGPGDASSDAAALDAKGTD